MYVLIAADVLNNRSEIICIFYYHFFDGANWQNAQTVHNLYSSKEEEQNLFQPNLIKLIQLETEPHLSLFPTTVLTLLTTVMATGGTCVLTSGAGRIHIAHSTVDFVKVPVIISSLH